MQKSCSASAESVQSPRSKLDALAASLRRAYTRNLTANGAKARPSVLEGAVLDQAAYLRARAIQAARDSSISVDQLTRITSSAAAADANVAEIIMARQQRTKALKPVVAGPVPVRASEEV